MEQKKHPEYQYLDLMKEILASGLKQVDKGAGVVTYSLFGRQIRFDLSQGFPLLTTKKVYWKGVVHELFWFLKGMSNIQYLVENNVHIWDDYPYKMYRSKMEKKEVTELSKEEFIEKIKNDDEFAKNFGELKYIYGELWRRWPTKDGRTVDQIKWVIEELKEDPDCHNAVVSSWNPEYLYRMAKPEEACRFPICHNMFQFNVKDGKLSLQLYQRSADIFLGVPFNIASYALLVHIVARLTGYKPGEFVHTFGDVHIYEDHIQAAKEQIEREPKNFPTVRLDVNATSLENVDPVHIILENYDPHPPIKATLAVVGGFIDSDQ